MSILRKEVIGNATLYLGDCLAVLPKLGKADAVITDPPYGIGKAEWDTEFPLEWFDPAAALVHTIAVMPGTWNLLSLPKERSGMVYKWTLSAHLTNGMTKGGFGWGNWIPCVVYKRRAEYVLEWCTAFAKWCASNGVGKKELDDACETSDMGGWYLGLLPHRSAIPTLDKWSKIKSAFSVPSELDPERSGEYAPQTDCKGFAIGLEPKPKHPSPKPLNVMRWFVSVVNPQTCIDPFMGSGTTGVAALQLGRKFIGIENVPEHFEEACERIENAQRQERLFA